MFQSLATKNPPSPPHNSSSVLYQGYSLLEGEGLSFSASGKGYHSVVQVAGAIGMEKELSLGSHDKNNFLTEA